MNIYDKTGGVKYDLKGEHIYWSIGGHDFAPFNVRGSNRTFNYTYRFKHQHPAYGNVKQEVQKALLNIVDTTLGRPMTICLSGRDSEIIVREAYNLGLVFDTVCLETWNNTDTVVNPAIKIAEELQIPLRVVPITKTIFFHEIFRHFYDMGCCYKPFYLMMPYLFEKIPVEHTIVVGEGDLNSPPELEYRNFTEGHPSGIPISLLEIAFRIWAQNTRRHGEYYFWSSTPGLILSTYHDDAMVKDFPYLSTHKVYQKYWPELVYKEKTNNWDDYFQYVKNKLLEKYPVKDNDKLRGCVIPHSALT